MKKITMGINHDDELKAVLVLNLKRLFIYIVMGLAVVFVMYMIAKPLPIAHFSYSTGRCQKVFIEGKECPCSMLPKKYEKVWVK